VPITMDMPNATASENYPCALAKRVLYRMGIQPLEVDLASAAAVDAAMPYISGIPDAWDK
jgi:hypothetical protein